MFSCELLCITLISLMYCAVSHGTIDAAGKISNKAEPPDKLSFQKPQRSDPRDDQQSFMSKLVTWILPFGTVSEDRRDFRGGEFYVPPSSSQSHNNKDCNSCNREPWIPITSSVGGGKTIVNFVPPIGNVGHISDHHYNDLSVLETLHPPPLSYKPVSQYNQPTIFRHADSNKPVHAQIYAFPPNKNEVILDYMVPPPIKYEIPSLLYAPPKTLTKLPSINPNYGPPRSIYNSNHQNGYNNQYLQQLPLPTFLSPPGDLNRFLHGAEDIYFKSTSSSNVPNINYQFSEVVKNNRIVPSDSYGAPVTGDPLVYLTPTEQLLQNKETEHLEGPIPLPNLSSFPILPFRNYENFNRKFLGNQQTNNIDVKIEDSVKIADYLAVVEHPIDVVQSPLIELSIQDNSYDGNKQPNEETNTGGSSSENLNVLNTGKDRNRPIENLYLNLHNPQTYTEPYIKEEKLHRQYENIKDTLRNLDENPISSKLNENPIVVEDIHAAASSNNNTFADSHEIQLKRSNAKHLGTSEANVNDKNPTLNHFTGTNVIKELILRNTTPGPYKSKGYLIPDNFTTSPLESNDWTPAYGISVPRFKVSRDSIATYTTSSVHQSTTSTNPKLLQIIVPYITNKEYETSEKQLQDINKKHLPHALKHNIVYTTLLPVFTPPITTEVSNWSRFNSPQPTITSTTPKTITSVYNIKEFLSKRTEHLAEDLPYDIISLQKHIDDWTQQSYSQKSQKRQEKLTGPKGIPSNYFIPQESNTNTEIPRVKDDITLPYSENLSTKTQSEGKIVDHNHDIDTNFITPVEPTTEKSPWNTSQVTISSQTREKIYVVTPEAYVSTTVRPLMAWSTAPKIENGRNNNGSTFDSYRFSVRIEPQSKTSLETVNREGKEALKIVYSEWPHLINNLQTTKRPSSRHPLFGLMDIPVYTLPANTSVETILGHSRVALAVTSTSVPPKKISRKISTAVVL